MIHPTSYSLKKDSTDEYTLKRDRTVWITVKNASIYIRAFDDGVLVDIYKKGNEADDPVVSCSAFDSELENDGDAE